MAFAAFVFCLISTIITAPAIIPLIWMIPLTVRTYRYAKRTQWMSTGMKVCILFFVSLIGGILLLCDQWPGPGPGNWGGPYGPNGPYGPYNNYGGYDIHHDN